MAVGELFAAAVPNEKTASEEGDRFAFSICFAGSTGERGSQAILTSLSSLLIALRSLFVEIAQAIKAILQTFTPLPCRMPGDFPRDKAAPTEMIAGIVIPGRSREPAIIAAVGIGLDDRDLSIICAARALAFVASAVVAVEAEMFRIEIKPEFLRRGWNRKGYRGRKG